MTKGDAGQNISKFAMSSTEASAISTSMPYISYVDLASWFGLLSDHLLSAVNSYISTHSTGRSAAGFKLFCEESSEFKDVFVCDG